jgi:hypothetical protein
MRCSKRWAKPVRSLGSMRKTDVVVHGDGDGRGSRVSAEDHPESIRQRAVVDRKAQAGTWCRGLRRGLGFRARGSAVAMSRGAIQRWHIGISPGKKRSFPALRVRIRGVSGPWCTGMTHAVPTPARHRQGPTKRHYRVHSHDAAVPVTSRTWDYPRLLLTLGLGAWGWYLGTHPGRWSFGLDDVNLAIHETGHLISRHSANG